MIFADLRMPSALCLLTETAAEKYSPPAGAIQLKEFTISSSIHVSMQVESFATLICHSLCHHWDMQDLRATGMNLKEGDGVVFVNRNDCYQGQCWIMLSCIVMIQLLERCLSVEDTTVVSGRGPRLVVCRSGEGSGQQLLHVEGTLTAVSRTEGNSIKTLSLCKDFLPSVSLMWCSLLEIICFRSCCESKQSTLLKSST